MKKTYCIEVNGSKDYFHYDDSTQEYTYRGKKLTIFKEVFDDFIHIANTLGFKVGKL